MIVFMYLFVNIVHTISPTVIVCKSALSRFVVLLRVTWVANQAANQNTIFCINVIKLKNDEQMLKMSLHSVSSPSS
uniref:Secreted protein n=1 Tax=Phocoena sinus TaxID=42100 RepID=A0A8C9CS12_PHOSS